jgi:hypothetical protein
VLSLTPSKLHLDLISIDLHDLQEPVRCWLVRMER